MNKFFAPLISIVMLAVLTGCGQDTASGPEAGSEETASGTVTLNDASGQELVFDEPPSSIATFDSGVLDILLSLGVEVSGRPSTRGQVPDRIADVPEIGNPHEPNFEQISKVNPEVLVAPLSFKRFENNLEQQGIKVFYTKAHSIADIQETITSLGQMLGLDAEAEEINETIEGRVDGVAANEDNAVKTLLVYGAPGTYLAALPTSLTGDLLEMAGGTNIASDFPNEENYPQYASLSPEKIVERNPEMIMLITHGDPEAVKQAFLGEMHKNPTWKNLNAVKNDRVVVLPPELFGTNPGTKVADALDVMVDNLSGAR